MNPAGWFQGEQWYGRVTAMQACSLIGVFENS